MTIKFDLAQVPKDRVQLIALYQSNVRVDVGRTFIFNPETKLFHLHFEPNETREPNELCLDPDVLFYLEVPGQNETAKCALANLDYQAIQRNEIAWLNK